MHPESTASDAKQSPDLIRPRGLHLFDDRAARRSSGAFLFTRIFVSKSRPAENPRYSWEGAYTKVPRPDLVRTGHPSMAAWGGRSDLLYVVADPPIHHVLGIVCTLVGGLVPS